MTGVVEGFRWALLDLPAFSVSSFLISLAAMILLFFASLTYFRRLEDKFADKV
jgi:ABC-type polysaccharide/polyol phosphate export permease